MWQKRWPESCYAGSTTTAGNLVFVGRNGGALQAYDARTASCSGASRPAPARTRPPTVFEHDGKEYLAFLAGGNSLAAPPHGDNLWLFSLDGHDGPAQAPGAGSGVEHAGEAPETSRRPASGGDATQATAVFADNCSGCHGVNGQGGNGGPDLTLDPGREAARDASSSRSRTAAAACRRSRAS